MLRKNILRPEYTFPRLLSIEMSNKLQPQNSKLQILRIEKLQNP